MTDRNDLEWAVEELQQRVVEAWALDAPDELNAKLALLAAARELSEGVKVLVGYLETDAIANFPDKTLDVEGGQWVKSSGSRREFREHEALIAAIADARQQDGDEYDIADGYRVVFHAIAGCLPASVGWKVTALKELGLDPDLFGEWKSGRASLRFVEDKRQADE